MEYEVVIPAAEKDYNKVPYLVESIKEFVNPLPTRVNVIHQDGNAASLAALFDIDYPLRNIVNERKVLNFDPHLAKNFKRAPWIYQQFLKLFQNITETNYYLVVDADLIFNKRVELFDSEEKPFFFLGIDQNHKPYFDYMEYMFGFGREYNHSFISELMTFRKDITDTLTHYFKLYQNIQQRLLKPDRYYTHDELVTELYEITCRWANNNWIPADYEIYGNFVEKIDHRLYNKRHIKSNLKGKYSVWTNPEIEAYIKEMKELDQHDVFTLHTWI